MQIDVKRIPELTKRGARIAFQMRHGALRMISFEEWLAKEMSAFRQRQRSRHTGLLEHWTLGAKNGLYGPFEELPVDWQEALIVANAVYSAAIRLEALAEVAPECSE